SITRVDLAYVEALVFVRDDTPVLVPFVHVRHVYREQALIAIDVVVQAVDDELVFEQPSLELEHTVVRRLDGSGQSHRCVSAGQTWYRLRHESGMPLNFMTASRSPGMSNPYFTRSKSSSAVIVRSEMLASRRRRISRVMNML